MDTASEISPNSNKNFFKPITNKLKSLPTVVLVIGLIAFLFIGNFIISSISTLRDGGSFSDILTNNQDWKIKGIPEKETKTRLEQEGLTYTEIKEIDSNFEKGFYTKSGVSIAYTLSKSNSNNIIMVYISADMRTNASEKKADILALIKICDFQAQNYIQNALLESLSDITKSNYTPLEYETDKSNMKYTFGPSQIALNKYWKNSISTRPELDRIFTVIINYK